MMPFLCAGPPTVSVLPEGPVRVKVGKSVTLECVSAGEPRSSARWTRIGAPNNVEQRMYGVVDSHTVLQVRQAFPWPQARAFSSLGLRVQPGPILEHMLRGKSREWADG